MMKKMLLGLMISALWISAMAQTMYNNGAQIGVMPGAAMIVRSDNVSNGSGSFENSNGGLLRNKGQLTVEGSFINSAGTADGYGAAGTYIVYKDWNNSATFNADSTKVYLRGNTQLITGSSSTTFYDLICETSGSSKVLTSADAAAQHTLTLNHNELNTTNFNFTVLNTDPAAIIQNGVNDAYVSSTGPGRLIRHTARKTEYLFPTGIDNGGTPKVREVAVVPANANARTYAVRMVENVPSQTTTTDDGYAVTSKSGAITAVNDVYYHLISSSDNAPADMSIYFDKNADNTWTSIARWQDAPQWEDLANNSESAGQSGSGRSRITRAGWVPSSDHAHALVTTTPVKLDFNFPSAFAPDANNAKPEDRYFSIINQGDLVTLEELSVFNRWGEMVYNNRRDGTDKWNGTFRGKMQQQGNYVFQATVRNKQTSKLYPTVTGNVMLLW